MYFHAVNILLPIDLIQLVLKVKYELGSSDCQKSRFAKLKGIDYRLHVFHSFISITGWNRESPVNSHYLHDNHYGLFPLYFSLQDTNNIM